ncbi:SdpA family antimicrobial peptide system protein [Pseudonocardia sp. ICBG1142]|uniref:SdpA family antimicrobial peptide system protein n=1 Tax=Pseudonocardia sp. ICBG1142 TaxID=2846760 RepID=UPI001CF626B9
MRATGSNSRTRAHCIALSAVLLLALVNAAATLPASPLFSQAAINVLEPVRSLLPQGWGFFTKNPREPALSIYAQRSGSWRVISEGSNASPKRAYGLDRTARTEQYEIEDLLKQSEKMPWTGCSVGDDLGSCLTNSDKKHHQPVSLASEHPRFCGNIALVTTDPVPWAWANHLFTQPSHYKLLTSSCSSLKRAAR